MLSSWLSLLFLFLKLYRTIIAGVLIECYLESIARMSAWFHLRKICHSFCPFSSGKIFLFCMENLSCRPSSFLRCSPLFYRPDVHILFCSVQKSFVVRKKWWRSCCLSIKLLCGKIPLRSVILKYFIPYPERFLVWLYSKCHCEQNYIVCRLWTRLVLFGNVDGSFICETSVDRSMGESVCRVFFWNEREREIWWRGMRSLLFFFRVSFVASFLLDVLYGVRNKSELCVQVFFKRWFWNGPITVCTY